MDLGKYKKAMRPKKYLDGNFVVYDPTLPDPSDVQLETRDTFAIGGGVIEGNDLGTREGFSDSRLNETKLDEPYLFSYDTPTGGKRYQAKVMGSDFSKAMRRAFPYTEEGKQQALEAIADHLSKYKTGSKIKKLKEPPDPKKPWRYKAVDGTKYFATEAEAEAFKQSRIEGAIAKRTKLPQEDYNKIVDRIKNGETLETIASDYNLKTPNPIRKLLRKNKVTYGQLTPNPSSYTQDPDLQKIVIDNYKKLSTKSLAQKLFPEDSIESAIQKYGNIRDTLKKENKIKVKPGYTEELQESFSKEPKDIQAKKIRDRRNKLIKEVSDLDIERYLREGKMNEGLDQAHRLSLKQVKKTNELYNVMNLGIESPDINREVIQSFEDKLTKLYDKQNKLVKDAKKYNKVPREISNQLSDLNKQISDVVAMTDGRLQGIHIDEFTLKPKVTGINYINTLGMGLIDKDVKDLSQADIDLAKAQMPYQIENEKARMESDKLKLEQKLQENPGMVESLKNSGFRCKREVGGKVDLECLADDVFKEQEKLKTGTDLQKKSAANKFKNAAKNISKTAGKARAGTLAALGGPIGLAIEGGIEGLLVGWDMLINDKPFKEAWADNTIFLGGMFSSKSGEDMRQEIIVGDDPLAQEYYNAKQKLDQYNKLQKNYQNSIGTDFEEQQYIKFKNYEESIKDEIPELIEVLKPGTEQQQAYMKSELEFRKKRAGAKYDKALGMSEDDPLSEGDPYATEQAKQRELSEVEEEVRGQYGKTFEDFKKEFGPLIYDQVSKYYGQEIKPGMYVEYDKKIDDILSKRYEEDLPFFKENINTEEPFPFYAAYAGGGRVGFKDGGSGMTRRGFLKVIGALASSIAAAKSGFVKFAGKEATKEVVTTAPISGKPEWFDAVVNKVIKEGADLTKQFATKEREIIHVQKLGEQEGARVVRDLETGAIRLDYDSPTNMGQDTISFTYKPGYIQEDGTKVGPYFQASEAEPRGIRMGPDDYDIEFDGENVVDAIEDLNSDVSTLKQYGTGKLDEKDLKVRKIKNEKVAKINEDQVEQANYLENKYGMTADDANDYDLNYQDYSDYD